jgi:hypothetical protein
MARQAAKLAPSPVKTDGFSWELPHANLTVEVRPEVFEQLVTDCDERGPLAWGFLLGTVALDTPIGRHFVVNDCVELDGVPGSFEPHQRMIAQTFGGAGAFPAVGMYIRPDSADSKQVAELILAVVGYLRTPLATVIMLRPGPDGQITAELNVRIAGEPLQRVHKTTTVLREGRPKAKVPAPEPRNPAVPIAPPVQRPQLAAPVRQPAAKRTHRWGQAVLLLAGIAVLMAGAVIVLDWRARSVQPNSETLQASAPTESVSRGLDVFAVRRGRDLEVTWNTAAPIVRTATRGSLFVTDGEERTQVMLEASHLTTGRVLYVPKTNDIDVRLDVVTARGDTVRESLRVLGAGRTAELPSRPQRQDQRPPDPAPAADARQQEVAAAPEAERPAPRTFLPPAPQRAFPEGSARIERLPELALSSSPGANPVPESILLRTVPAPREEVTPPAPAEPARRTAPAPAPFVPAAPLQKVPVSIPPAVRLMLTGQAVVEVRVRVDENGRVTKADTTTQQSPLHTHLAGLARNAAYMWRFTPAKIGDRPVPSDYVIVFKFVR